MHITGVSIKGLPPLEDILFRCNKRVNLFVGPNATGMSTILRSLVDFILRKSTAWFE